MVSNCTMRQHMPAGSVPVRYCGGRHAVGGCGTVPRQIRRSVRIAAHPEVIEAYSSTPVPLAPRPLPAIISCASRSPDDVAGEVIAMLGASNSTQALVSGVEPDMFAALRKLVDGAQYHARAKMLICRGSNGTRRPKLPGSVCVVSGGAEDQAAADQVRLAAEHLGCYVIGKASLSTRNMHALMAQEAALQAADVVVVVAGCDPALPAVIAGLVDAPVVAVPTSSGSSGNMGGLGVLAAAVASATPGVAVVGVDDAIAAAVMAARVLRTAAVRMERLAAASAAAAAAMPASPAHAMPAVVLPPAEPHSMLPPQCVEAGLTMQAGQAQATVARAR